MLTIVTWLWKGSAWRSCYAAEHVNALERMVAANLTIPHRFICVTDIPEGINCPTVPLDWEIKTNTPERQANCYRRLKAFSEDSRSWLGDRFVSIDLDVVVMKDITPIIDRPQDDFVILEGTAAPYNGSMWMMDTGCRRKVWDDFVPDSSPQKVQALSNQAGGRRYYGSDQAWISAKLPHEKMWTRKDGIYQFQADIDKGLPFPADARMVFFAGGMKPWSQAGFTVLANEYNKYV